MRISFDFLLTYNWNDNKVTKSNEYSHYVDFNSHTTGQVVLRLQFDAKCNGEDNCTQSQVGPLLSMIYVIYDIC